MLICEDFMWAVRIKLGVQVAELGGLFLITFGRLSVENGLPIDMVLHQQKKKLSELLLKLLTVVALLDVLMHHTRYATLISWELWQKLETLQRHRFKAFPFSIVFKGILKSPSSALHFL